MLRFLYPLLVDSHESLLPGLHLCINASIADLVVPVQPVIMNIYNSVSYNMSLFDTTIGWLAPPTCVGCSAEGSVLCEGCSTSGIIPFGERCWRCNELSERCRTCSRCRRFGFLKCVWITTDYHGLPQTLIRTYKFGNQRFAAYPIAKLMAETFRMFNSDDEISKMNYLLVHVPTATGRVRQRSFDHAKLLSRQLALVLKLEPVNALLRIGQSRQVGAHRSDRLTQTKENYLVKNAARIKGRNILLIDDVVTTGATLQAAAKSLKAAGAKSINALVFAKRL